MYVKIHSAKKDNNRGSCRDLINYLEKENQEKDLLNQEKFFDQKSSDVSFYSAEASIDNNKGKLGKDETKFYMISVNPSKDELRHISKKVSGRDIKNISQLTAIELKRYEEALKDYTRPVAYEVAQRLGLPLDVFVVRKLGVPGYEELAMGAIASGNVSVLNEDVMRALPNSETILEMVMAQEKIELERREARYRQDRPAPDLRGRVVILVDDGLATGATMRAAAAALRKQGVAKIVVAVPVGAPETCQELDSEVDEMICAFMPAFFHGVGQFYEDFSQTTDEEVRELLARRTTALQRPSR